MLILFTVTPERTSALFVKDRSIYYVLSKPRLEAASINQPWINLINIRPRLSHSSFDV